MKILVLGGTGMLGHKMFQTLQARFDDVHTTMHGPVERWSKVGLYQQDNVITRFDAQDLAAVKKILQEMRPDVVVNCLGVIKQRADANSVVPSLTLNSLLPHHLAATLAEWNGRLVHFSTDCVFSGKRGNYTEADQSDAEDLYGRSKFLGEVTAPNALTLRTSMIGRELTHFHSLLEWYLRQKGNRVEGYKHALYSGLTTNRLSKIVGDLIQDFPKLSGLYQVTGNTISKYELLRLIEKSFKTTVEVVPDEMVYCDRSMSGEKFQAATGFQPPPWPELIDELAADKTPYAEWATGNQ